MTDKLVLGIVGIALLHRLRIVGSPYLLSQYIAYIVIGIPTVMGGQAFGNICIVYATNRAGRAVTVVSAPINIAVLCLKLGVARVPDKSIVLFVDPRQAVIEVGNSIRRAGAELNIERQVIFVGIVEIHITALAVEFVVQIGRLVKLVVGCLDIAAVVAAHLQEPAYVIVEIGKHSVAVLGVAGEIAVGVVSPIELRSSIVRP